MMGTVPDSEAVEFDFHFRYGIDMPELERQFNALEELLSIAFNHPEYEVRILGETAEPLREVVFDMLQQHKVTQSP